MELVPHDYQIRAINYIMENKAVFLMADMGTGKTMISLKAIRRAGIPAFVLAPLRPCFNTWPEEIEKWTPELSYTILHGPKKDAKLKLERDIYIVPYSSLKWWFEKCCQRQFRLRKFFMVYDESSMVKDHSTQRFKMLKQMEPIWSDYRLNLSATPSPNGLEELWPQTYLLDKGVTLGQTVTSFRSKYFKESGPPRWSVQALPGASDMIHDKMKDISFRLDANDYLKMPSISYNHIRVDMGVKLRKKYDHLREEFMMELEECYDNAALSEALLTNKLRQFLQGALYVDGGPAFDVVHTKKVEALKEVVETSAGQPILCAIQYKFEYEMIRKALGYDVPIVYGKTSAKAGAEYIRRWNRSELPLMLCHPASIGHGMNLQSGGNIILWYGLPFSFELFKQLNGRLHRQGQKHGVLVNSILFGNSVDMRIWDVLKKKNATNRDLLNAVRGVS